MHTDEEAVIREKASSLQQEGARKQDMGTWYRRCAEPAKRWAHTPDTLNWRIQSVPEFSKTLTRDGLTTHGLLRNPPVGHAGKLQCIRLMLASYSRLPRLEQLTR